MKKGKTPTTDKKQLEEVDALGEFEIKLIKKCLNYLLRFMFIAYVYIAKQTRSLEYEDYNTINIISHMAKLLLRTLLEE